LSGIAVDKRVVSAGTYFLQLRRSGLQSGIDGVRVVCGTLRVASTREVGSRLALRILSSLKTGNLQEISAVLGCRGCRGVRRPREIPFVRTLGFPIWRRGRGRPTIWRL
jgi:hypothetical protein